MPIKHIRHLLPVALLFLAVPAVAQQANDDARLQARVTTARAVIVGHVIDIRRAFEPNVRPSEHNPEWAIALVAVDRALKGQPRLRECPKGTCVEVAFAQSTDIRWLRTPKLTPGREAIFLLRPADPKLLGPTEAPPATYVLTDPEDLRPLADEERLRAIIAATR